MPFAEIRGQKLYFEDTGGSGTPVLLMHGFLMDGTMFAPQVEALRSTHRVITLDARGFGRTEWDRKPFTYWDNAADALALLDHLGVESAVVGGMSQGGFASLRAALLAPARVKGLVLMSTQAGVDTPEVLASYRQMMETWIAMGPIDPLVQAIAGLILGPQQFWEPWVTNWRKSEPAAFREPSMCLIERDDITPRIGEIKAPAIIFHGTADQAIGMSRAEILAKGLEGCRGLVPVEGAHHAANLTHPDQVNPRLVEFLRSIG
ncbi:MAG: alpha/beta hydrolase [Polyangiaceae bacterium]